MARAHLREQVYGLSDLAESNDLDSDIASPADWLKTLSTDMALTGNRAAQARAA